MIVSSKESVIGMTNDRLITETRAGVHSLIGPENDLVGKFCRESITTYLFFLTALSVNESVSSVKSYS